MTSALPRGCHCHGRLHKFVANFPNEPLFPDKRATDLFASRNSVYAVTHRDKDFGLARVDSRSCTPNPESFYHRQDTHLFMPDIVAPCLSWRRPSAINAPFLPLSVAHNPINDTCVLSSVAAVLIGVAEATQEEPPRDERQALRSAPGPLSPLSFKISSYASRED